jgi:CRISPR/Cas system-associated exonuclease Cas4 (RecB family)
MIPAPPLSGPSVATTTAPGDALSPSQVSTIMDCSYRWYAKKVLRIPEPPTANQILGRAVHTALATNFDQKCETREDLSVVGVVAVFREAWAVFSEGMEFRDDEDGDEFGKTGEALVTKYMEQAAPKIEPVAVEMRVEGVIAGVKVSGYIDLLDVNGCVIDIKTAKARPTHANPMQRFQVATYCYLTPRAQGTGRIDTLVKTKSPQLIQQTFSISEQELKAIEALYPEAQELMRGNVHLPNRHSMLCSRRQCAFWRHCEQKWGGEVPEI